MRKTVVLAILDGWGMRPAAVDNAISEANPHFFNSLWQRYPHALLENYGEAVGLLPGMVGNSEVGHFTIGAGTNIQQNVARISHDIANHKFQANPELLKISHQAPQKIVHLIGLLGSGSVHSHLDHLQALVAYFTARNFTVHLHVFTDGRDSGIHDSIKLLERLPATLKNLIQTICGRYYGMDRNGNWDRTQIAFDLIVNGLGTACASFEETLKGYHQAGISDEFIPPLKKSSYSGISSEALLFFFNFREDRLRQLARMCAQATTHVASLVELEDVELKEKVSCVYPKIRYENTISDEAAALGLSQVHIAENEKAAHITYFINGGREQALTGEEFHIVPSLKIESYADQPHMSAQLITTYACQIIGYVDLIILNYANADMVGHTGSLSAAIEAIKCIDSQLEQLYSCITRCDGHLFITSDHGNAEVMVNQQTGLPDTEHNIYPSPFMYVGSSQIDISRATTLADIKNYVMQILKNP